MTNFGIVELDGSTPLPIWGLCLNGSSVPVAPDLNACSVSVYEAGQNTPITDFNAQAMTQLTPPAGIPAALFSFSLSPTSSAGFESGQSYGVLITYVISSVQYAQVGSFTVT